MFALTKKNYINKRLNNNKFIIYYKKIENYLV
jgi:hypothetical protein